MDYAKTFSWILWCDWGKHCPARSCSPLLYPFVPQVPLIFLDIFPSTLMSSVSNWFYVSTESLRLTSKRKYNSIPSDTDKMTNMFIFNCIFVLASDIISLLFRVNKSSVLCKLLKRRPFFKKWFVLKNWIKLLFFYNC